MLLKESIIIELDKLLGQTGFIRKSCDVQYFCPKCKHYKRKLEINLSNGKYNCWVCGFRGSNFLSLLRNLNAEKRYYTFFESISKIKLSILEPIKTENTPVLPEEYKTFDEVNSSDFHYKNAMNYLLHRNISNLDILRYNIGYCPTGEYAGRIIIPSYDINGILNFFSGRSYYDSIYKYRLCNTSKNIIGFESLINFNEPITLVEGQFDAIAVRRNCIPLFGKTMSKMLKYKILESNVPRVNVLLDNDADKEALCICQFLLKNNIPTYFVKLQGKDPSVLGFKETWNFIKSAKKLEFENFIKTKLEI